jgi:chorismate mutase/prephenate dehydrogenase
MGLEEIRKDIEDTDRKILELMAHRLELAEEVGRTKVASDSPVRNMEAEKRVIDRYRGFALEHGMSPVTAEAVCKLLMMESIERQARMPRPSSNPRHVAIIGGSGKMGRWFADLLRGSGHRVDIIDPSAGNGLTVEDCKWADIVIISIPISRTAGMLRSVDAIAKDDALIFDISSLKSPFIDVLKDMATRRKVCSVHPMFGPSAESMYDRNLLICDCGCPKAADEAESLLGGHGANIKRIPVEDHDKYMSYVLGLSHAINIAFFTVLERSGISFEEMKSVASTTYNKLMESNLSVAMEDPYLYYEIQHMNSYLKEMLSEFEQSGKDVISAALNDSPQDFKDLMDRGREYFTQRSSH